MTTPKDERARLRALRDTGLLDSLPDQVFDDLVKLATALTGAPMAMINLVAEDRQWTKAAVGFPFGLELPRKVAFCSHIVRDKQELIVEDTRADPRFSNNPLVTGAPHLRYYAGAPIHSEDGEVLGAICVLDSEPRRPQGGEMEHLRALSRQVTRLAEVSRNQVVAEQATGALRDVFLDLAAFFTGAPALLCIIGLRGEIKHASRQWVECLGYPIDALLATPVHELLHPDDLGPARMALKLLKRAEPVLDIELRLRCASGRYQVLRVYSCPSQDGELIYVVAKDVSREREVERLRAEFVSMVSHELRTPLTSIHGTMRLLEAGVVGELPPEASDLVRVASTNSMRLIRLVNDLLDLDRIESGRLHLSRAPVRVDALLVRVQQELDVLAVQRSLRLEVQHDAGLVVTGDRDRLLQVLVNLGANAIKFSPPGGVVTFQALRRPGGQVRLVVHDQGPGIPQDQQGRIFERFVQVDGSVQRPAEGTGLGLAICKAIVEEHRGRIGVDSVAGEGASFWVNLTERVEERVAVVQRDRSGLGPLVLVYEPSEARTAPLRSALTEQGCRVRWVRELGQLKRAVAERRFAAVLLSDSEEAGIEPSVLRKLARSSPGASLVAVSRSPAGSWVGAPEVRGVLRCPEDMGALGGALRRTLRRPGPARVLVVEDHPSTSAAIQQCLKELPVECHVATDGAAAISLTHALDPDLIVLDLRLPRVDGFTVVAALREHEACWTPLVTYSGQELNDFERDLLRLGPTRHLNKASTSPVELAEEVRELLAELLPPRR